MTIKERRGTPSLRAGGERRETALASAGHIVGRISVGICVGLGVAWYPAVAGAQSISPATPSASMQSGSTPAPEFKQRDIVDGPPLSTSNVPSGNGNASATLKLHPEVIDKRTLDDTLTGMVNEQVITTTGQNFFSYFTTAWQGFALSNRYNVSIHEKPSARWGSLVWVEFEHRHLFETFISPTRSDIRQIGEQAAASAYQKVVRTDIERLLFKDQDLGPDEL